MHGQPDEIGQSNDNTETTEQNSEVLARLLWLTLFLATAWLLWSGLYKPLLLALGAVSIALTLYIANRTGYFKSSVFAFRYNLRLVLYWGWLGGEIVRSSIAVARIVLAPELRNQPRIVRLDVSHLEPVDQVLFANSITLTPGTLSLDIHEGQLLVHAIDIEGARDLLGGEMMRRVEKLRGI